MSDLDDLESDFSGMNDMPFRVARKRKRKAAGTQVTHCFRGHEFTAENTIMQASGKRCRKCLRLWTICREDS